MTNHNVYFIICQSINLISIIYANIAQQIAYIIKPKQIHSLYKNIINRCLFSIGHRTGASSIFLAPLRQSWGFDVNLLHVVYVGWFEKKNVRFPRQSWILFRQLIMSENELRVAFVLSSPILFPSNCEKITLVLLHTNQ